MSQKSGMYNYIIKTLQKINFQTLKKVNYETKFIIDYALAKISIPNSKQTKNNWQKYRTILMTISNNNKKNIKCQ